MQLRPAYLRHCISQQAGSKHNACILIVAAWRQVILQSRCLMTVDTDVIKRKLFAGIISFLVILLVRMN